MKEQKARIKAKCRMFNSWISACLFALIHIFESPRLAYVIGAGDKGHYAVIYGK